jgi:Asp-tRNA(Asn)/Glu-tRNA(Gln) amidotransferase A subunit family amidase
VLYEEAKNDEHNATVVTILEDHDLIVAGKTVTTEFAWTMHGKHTANPHNLGYSPGGSSSGSAAAVANFEIPLAIGSQTFGSIIRPASYCGIYGYKPTHGLVPTHGMRGFAPTVDTVGFFSRSVEDMQALATIFDISDAQPPTFVGLKGAKVAWCKTPSWKKASPAAKNALTKAIALLRRHNVTVEELVLPSTFDNAIQCHRIIATKELSRNIQDELNPDLDDKLDRMLLDFIAEGKEYTTAQYRDAMECYSALRTQFDALTQPYEAIITLSATGEPPKGLAWTGDSSMNSMWTVGLLRSTLRSWLMYAQALHVPCISIPGFGEENGLPIGMQLVQARWRDQQLLKVAKEVGRIFEAEGDWKSKL